MAAPREYAESECEAFCTGLKRSVALSHPLRLVRDNAEIRAHFRRCVSVNLAGLLLSNLLLSGVVRLSTAGAKRSLLTAALSAIPSLWAAATYLVAFPANMLWSAEMFNTAYELEGYTATRAECTDTYRDPLRSASDKVFGTLVVVTTCAFQFLALSALPAAVDRCIARLRNERLTRAWAAVALAASFLYEAWTYGFYVLEPRLSRNFLQHERRIEWFEKRPGFCLGFALPGLLLQALARTYLGGAFAGLAVYSVVYPLQTLVSVKADVKRSRVAGARRLGVFAAPVWMANQLQKCMGMLRKRKGS
eukprot:TRINITY_DN3918_c0_g1_i1.p1 TRINITY_DN3918_c0_g1~~TRINITY_DN3918_c0_g1_i1.p1  ORF type:complete len:323 (+),score=71.51 TRINITY_DN3918_c0_g1_i1:54-971(+)